MALLTDPLTDRTELVKLFSDSDFIRSVDLAADVTRQTGYETAFRVARGLLCEEKVIIGDEESVGGNTGRRRLAREFKEKFGISALLNPKKFSKYVEEKNRTEIGEYFPNECGSSEAVNHECIFDFHTHPSYSMTTDLKYIEIPSSLDLRRLGRPIGMVLAVSHKSRSAFCLYNSKVSNKDLKKFNGEIEDQHYSPDLPLDYRMQEAGLVRGVFSKDKFVFHRYSEYGEQFSIEATEALAMLK